MPTIFIFGILFGLLEYILIGFIADIAIGLIYTQVYIQHY